MFLACDDFVWGNGDNRYKKVPVLPPNGIILIRNETMVSKAGGRRIEDVFPVSENDPPAQFVSGFFRIVRWKP